MRKLGTRILIALVGLALGTMLLVAPPTAHIAAYAEGDPPQQLECSAGVNAKPPQPRQVNLVLDDSGSMFSDGDKALDRWSNAKYSLEVFAAMLGADDSLNVYRMSDFADGNIAGPQVVMSGDIPTSERVARIHAMQLQGGGTPYAPVTTAARDLVISSAPDRWLVILSDGEFNDRSTADVQSDLLKFAAENTNETVGLRVAFLAIGPDAPQITHAPEAGLFFERAAKTSDLIGTMTSFSNRIFAKSLLPQSSPGQINPDVDLEQVLVFAQGSDVRIGELSTGGDTSKPKAEVEVAWSSNIDANFEGRKVSAQPNKALRGMLATFEDVPRGTGVFAVEGAQAIDVFYTPRAAFGIELRDDAGNRIDADKVVGGEYTVEYGFMDRNCEFIDSDLFGTVAYTAEVIQNGEVISAAFKNGDSISLERGDAQFNVRATYLSGNTSEAVIDLRVLRPAKPTAFDAAAATFNVSELEENLFPHDAWELTYAIAEAGKTVDFGVEEWASFNPESFTVTSERKNIEFEILVGDAPGQVLVLPRAPDGDTLAAATGDIPVTISASHIFDEQLNEATYEAVITVNDDYSLLDRFWNWFAEVGWKWLLLALAIIWILGYFVRPTFSRRIKASPTGTFKPRSRGRRSPYRAKFVTDRLGALVPYKARTATLSYAQRGPFIPMKLRARRGKRIEVLNWKPIAQKENVRINGEELNKQTTKPPMLRAVSSVTAVGPDGTYDMTLNV